VSGVSVPFFAVRATQGRQVSVILLLASGHWFLARSKKQEASGQKADTYLLNRAAMRKHKGKQLYGIQKILTTSSSSLSFRRKSCYPPLTICSGFLIAETFKRFAAGITGEE
jgi:hypothetical protein